MSETFSGSCALCGVDLPVREYSERELMQPLIEFCDAHTSEETQQCHDDCMGYDERDDLLDQQKADEEEAMFSELNDWANALIIENDPHYSGDSFPMVSCYDGCRDSVLPYASYMAQLKKPNAKWKCPKCGREAWWEGVGGFE